jgi:RHS repeat-associated protein
MLCIYFSSYIQISFLMVAPATAQTSAINQPGWAGDTGYLQECWAEQYSYDPWGNLVSIAPSLSSNYTGCSQESGFNLTGAISSKNQIAAAGYQYDSAGNLIAAPPTGTIYTFDAENRLVSAGGQTYLYDGDGKRVEKGTGSPLAATKLYWYGTDSNPVLETDAGGNELYRYIYFAGRLVKREEANDWVDHYGLDALGNVRFVYGYSGTNDVSEYYPFGGERILQSQTNNNRKFTGKERDSESGLDNFGARYDSSSMGRFMSPDPMGGHPQDPQTLNRYAYVRNNPVSLTDPTGLDFYLRCGDNSDTCQNHRVGNFATNDDGSRGAFNATVVTSDSIRNGDNSAAVGPNGVEVTTGGKAYTGEYFENPDSIKMENVNGESTFVDHNQITLGGKAGSGLENFSFFVNGNCSGTCLASGTFDFNSTPDQTRNYLDAHGAFRSIVDRTIPLYGASLDEEFFHQGTTQHRFGEGPSLHVSVPRDPKATVPTMGLFHVDKDAPGLAHAGCAWFGVGCH